MSQKVNGWVPFFESEGHKDNKINKKYTSEGKVYSRFSWKNLFVVAVVSFVLKFFIEGDIIHFCLTVIGLICLGSGISGYVKYLKESNLNKNTKHTITYLNSKIWYRFLKVIYIGILFISIFATISNEYDNLQKQQAVNRFNFAMDTSSVDVVNKYEGTETGVDPQAIDKQFGGTTILNTQNSNKNLIINSIYKILPYLILELMIFELIRRIFYYIYLGSFFPIK